MKIPFWLLRLLPMWEYICPKCRRKVKRNAHECPHCGERFPLAVKVPPNFLKDPKALEHYVHEHVFPRISKFERDYLTQYFTTIFSDGFESGSLSAWTGNGVSGFTLAVSTDVVHHGSYSLKAVGGNGSGEYAELYKDFTSGTAYYMRVYVYLLNLPANNYIYWLGPCFLSSGDSNIVGAGIRRQAGPTYNWCICNGGINPHAYYHAANSTINTSQWYCLEVYCYVAISPNGVAQLWVDGNLVVNQTGMTTNYHGNIARGACMVYTENGAYDSVDRTFYFDCAVIADTYNGPESATTVKTVPDSLSLNDSTIINKPVATADTVSVLDAVLRHKPDMAVPDVLVAAETVLAAKMLTVADSVNLADVLKVLKSLIVQDAMALVDAADTPSRVLRALDSVSLAEDARVNKVLLVNESVSLAEVVEAGTGGAKKTRLFLILGDLAVQLTGD